MPLTRKVNFKTTLKSRNLLQIPNVVRWEFKMEKDQALKVTVNVVGLFSNTETFLTKMRKDGRITVPKLVLALLKKKESSLEGYAMEVTLEPT